MARDESDHADNADRGQELFAITPQFVALRHVPRRRLVARIIGGPFLWLAALSVAGFYMKKTHAIAFGFLCGLISFLLGLVVLLLLRQLRLRDERAGSVERG